MRTFIWNAGSLSSWFWIDSVLLFSIISSCIASQIILNYFFKSQSEIKGMCQLLVEGQKKGKARLMEENMPLCTLEQAQCTHQCQ